MERSIRVRTSDAIIWIAAACLVAVLSTIVTRSVDGSVVAGIQRLGFENPGDVHWWPLVGAGLLAVVVSLAARRISELSWVWLQVSYGLIAALWTTLLVAARHPVLPRDQPTAFLGHGYARLLSELSQHSPLLAAALVGVVTGLATVLINAAMQSLAGGIQARRLAGVIALIPLASWLADGYGGYAMLWVAAVLALGAMASERGRGLRWSTGFGLVSGLLLSAAALTEFAASAAGIGLLCIYFLRRRSLMILVSAVGLILGLLIAAALGWSWPAEFGAASSARWETFGTLVINAVTIGVLVLAAGGVATVAALRKLPHTPAWPLPVTAAGALIVGIFTLPSGMSALAALACWQALFLVGAVAPDQPASARVAAPEQPQQPTLAVPLTAATGLGITALSLLIG